MPDLGLAHPGQKMHVSDETVNHGASFVAGEASTADLSCDLQLREEQKSGLTLWGYRCLSCLVLQTYQDPVLALISRYCIADFTQESPQHVNLDTL